MPGDSWLVHNSGVQTFNDTLVAAVNACEDIISEVEAVLATMPQAAQTNALSPWNDLRTRWDNAYKDMVDRLQCTGLAGMETHEAYKWGDRQSYMAMM